jgi:hypothetical protein
MAVDLAKLSLWLVTLAKDHPFTFLDHSLRHGDSLVGLTREQIIGFHWEPKKQMKFGEDLIQKRLDRATEARAKILSAREDVAYRDQEQRMAVADEALDLIRLVGDACVSCFFAADKTKAREQELERVFGLASSYFSSLSPNNQSQTTTVDFQSRAALQAAADRLKSAPHPIPCFHWEIEFPEVFSRENGGFDAFVGNPPFLGGRRTSTTLGVGFSEWLASIFLESSNNADLVGFFYRQAFNLLRVGGTFGLIATNTIAQGDTRQTALRWICNHEGTIYSVTKRIRWPGQAAVVVSVIHILKGALVPPFNLDGLATNLITAYLFHAGGNENPQSLRENEGKSFQGMIVLGMGFTFDDDDYSGKSTSLQEMRDLIAKNPKNQERIFPYIGGEEILNSPTHTHRRYVIDFNDFSFEKASEWPDLLAIIREKAKPDRDKQNRKPLREKWWQFADKRPALRQAIAVLDRVLVHPFTSSHVAFTFVPATVIVAGPHQVFPITSYAEFGNLQSRCHEVWARFFASSMKDDLRYTPSDCLDTFPFVSDLSEIEEYCRIYYGFRADRMTSAGEGLTQTYNRFHSPDERDEGIMELRRLHGLMDAAVLRAYGWEDLAESARCEFLLDYEEEEDDESSAADSGGSGRVKKKPWRYRWPDDFRDEVLARLLELNEQRHKEGLLANAKAISEEPTLVKKTKKKPEAVTKRVHDPDKLSQQELF